MSASLVDFSSSVSASIVMAIASAAMSSSDEAIQAAVNDLMDVLGSLAYHRIDGGNALGQ